MVFKNEIEIKGGEKMSRIKKRRFCREPTITNLDNPSHHITKGMINMLICRKFITRKDGTRVYASQLGLEAICFEVSDEKHQAYLEKKKKAKSTDK